MKNLLLLLVSIFVFTCSNATVRTASVSGNWNSTSTWGGTVPVANDDVVINSGITVTINTNPVNINNVTINGTLQFDATGTGRTWTINQGLTINSGGIFNCAAPGTATTHTLNYNGTSISNNGTFNMVNGTNKCNVTIGGSTTQTLSGSSSVSFNKLTLNNTGGKFQIDYGGGSFTPSEVNPTKLNVSISTADSLVIKQGLLIGCATNNSTISHTIANLSMGSGGSKITSSVNIFTSVTTITVNTGMILNDATNSNVSMTVNGTFISPSMSQSNAATAFALNGPNCFGGASQSTAATFQGDWNMTDIFVCAGNTKLLGGTEPGQPKFILNGSVHWESTETHTIDLPFTSDDFYIKTCFFGTFDSGTASPQVYLSGGNISGTPKSFNIAFDVFNAEVQESSPLGSLTKAQISSADADWIVNGHYEVVSGASIAVHSDHTIDIEGKLTVRSGGEVAGAESETDDTGYNPVAGPTLTMGASGILLTENSLGLGNGTLAEASSDVAVKNRTADLDWNLNSISSSGTIDYETNSQTVTDKTYNNLSLSGGTKTLANSITINGSLANGTSTTLADAGFTVNAKGNVTNNGTHSGSGKISLSGSSNQSLNGTGTEWGNLEINNATGCTCSSNVATTGAVTLTNGNINTSSSAKLSLGAAGTITNGSSSSCVVGPMSKTTTSTGSFNFPLGKGGNYRLLTLVPSSNSSTTWTAEFFNSAFSNTSSVTTPVTSVNNHVYYALTKSGSANATLTIQFSGLEALPDLNGLVVATWSGSSWTNGGNTGTTGSASSGTITSSTISTFNDITLGEITSVTTSAISGSPFCPGASVNIPFTSVGTMNGGNIYTAQLSSKSGSFAAPVNIGILSSTANSGTINGTIPTTTKGATKYRIRVVSSSPSAIGTDNGTNLTVTTCGAPTGITVNGITQTTATVNWNTVTCAFTYTIQYRKQGTTTWTKKKNLTGTSKQLTGLLANTTYEYQMQTICTSDNKSKSSLTPIQTFTTSLKLDANETADRTSFTMFPNPASDQIMISISSGENQSGKIFVFNAVGELMVQQVFDVQEGSNQLSLDIHSLSSGVYFVKVISGEEISMQKLIKE